MVDREDVDMVHGNSHADMEDTGKKKQGPGKRGQRTTKQKKKKMKNVERARAVAERMQTKVKKSGVKLAKKKSSKTLWEK